MGIDKKILSEIERYRFINNYLNEQVAPETAAAAAPPPPPTGEVAPPPAEPTPAAPPTPIDVESDPEVEKIDDKGKSEESDGGTEELEVTDLVKSQENIEKKQEEYFNNLFSQIDNLEKRLADMDTIVNKLNSLESKIEKYREKTPQEKLELRTYDSYPFTQKLSDFFEDKKEEMEKTGKHDYVLTSDEVEDINPSEIRQSFQPDEDKFV